MTKKPTYEELEKRVKDLEHSKLELELNFQRAQKISRIGSWDWDPTTDEVTHTDMIFEIFGINKSDFEGNFASMLSNLVHPDDSAIVQEAAEKAQATGVGSDVTYRIIRPDGKIRWIHALGESLFEDGQLIKMIGTNQDITELKIAEETLQKSNEKYRRLFDNTVSPIYIFDVKKNFIDSNQAGLNLLGYSRDELLQMSVHDVDVDTEIVIPAHKQVLHGSDLSNYEHQLKSKDGKIITVLNNSIPLKDDVGNTIGIQSILMDITEQKQAEKALKENKRDLKQSNIDLSASLVFLDTVISESPVGITIYNEMGDCIAANESITGLIGATKLQILEQNFRAHRSWKDSGLLAVANRTLEENKKGRVEVSIRSSFGKLVNLDCQLVPFPNGDEQNLMVMFSDITELRKSEQEILLLSKAVEQSPVSIIITDADAKIEYVNLSFEKITGYSSEEVIGKNPRILKSGKTPRRVYKDLWQTITQGKTSDCEFQNRKKNGEIFWENAHFSSVKNNEGVITHYLALKEDITDRKIQEEKILHQAHFDALTDLPNRFLSLDRLSQLLIEAERNNKQVAVLFIDLDDFKKVNDSHGHDTGDKLLIKAADRLSSVIRSGDTVGRLGGDEFIVLLSSLDKASDAQPIAENLLEKFREAFCIDKRELIITASIGISIFPEDGKDASELLRHADSAMYHSKDLGRNSYSYFTDAMNQNISRRLSLEEQLIGALDRNEFSVFYQPKFDITTSQIMGAEALLRWSNPALGDIPPDEFIPIAEHTGLIVPLGEYVLKEALDRTVQWQKTYFPEFQIAVNVSPRQFRDLGFVPFIAAAISDAGIRGDHLELEITEGVLMGSYSYIDDALDEINNLRVSIAMDDFGTGYSSLSYLRSYPFNVLKIDRSFVNDISVDIADRELTNAAIAMAHGLNLKVVAEGVETEEQLALLQKLNCDYGQGYLFSKPVSAEKFTELLKADSQIHNSD